MYTRWRNFYPAGASSATTSPAYYAGDAWSLSLEIGASASTVTIQTSNAEGFNTALAEADWSTTSVIATLGDYKIEPGFRWLRTIRTLSTNTVRLAVQQQSSN